MSRLKKLTGMLLDAGSEVHTLRPELLELTAILSGAETTGIQRNEQIDEGQTLTPEGVAISPTNAMMCADDYVRTIKFIRGAHAAIADQKKRHPERPVRVLYAGCGPYAMLALPLMSMWSADEATFTLLDIHRESIDAARSIVDSLGLGDSVREYEVADAGSYLIPDNWLPDIILMELMQACLEKEPQVAVARHLHRQAPNAVMIPEEVRIELKLVDLSCEFTLDDGEQGAPRLRRDRIHVDTLFRLNREALESWDAGVEGPLPGARVQVPFPPESRYHMMLFTMIEIYGINALGDYDSGLTVPRAIGANLNFKPGDNVQFFYRCGEQPGLACRVLERQPEEGKKSRGVQLNEMELPR